MSIYTTVFLVIAEAGADLASNNGSNEGAFEAIVNEFGLDTPLLVAQAINFLIVAYVIWRFGFKRILGTMEEREKTIASGLQYAEEVKIKLADTERQHEETLKEASAEAQQTLASAREQAKAFEDQLRKDAVARAEDIVRKASEQMELERQTMVAEAKKEFAKLVVDTSAKVLDRELGDEEKIRFGETAAKEIAKI
jgi:F-type H+-transporting ATPase subunit b